MVCDQSRNKEIHFFGEEGYIQQNGHAENFVLDGDSLPDAPPLVGNPNIPIRKIQGIKLVLLNVMILKRESESIFFQSNEFTACKVKDGKLLVKSLMVFNLLKILHPFLGKKHLRTLWNLNDNLQEYFIYY